MYKVAEIQGEREGERGREGVWEREGGGEIERKREREGGKEGY